MTEWTESPGGALGTNVKTMVMPLGNFMARFMMSTQWSPLFGKEAASVLLADGLDSNIDWNVRKYKTLLGFMSTKQSALKDAVNKIISLGNRPIMNGNTLPTADELKQQLVSMGVPDIDFEPETGQRWRSVLVMGTACPGCGQPVTIVFSPYTMVQFIGCKGYPTCPGPYKSKPQDGFRVNPSAYPGWRQQVQPEHMAPEVDSDVPF